jgi:hypothetical protein
LRRLAILLAAVVAAGAVTVTASPPAAASSHCSARTVAPPGSRPASRKIILNVCKGDTLIGDYWYWENATHSYSGNGSGTTASAMIVHFCLTLWYGSQKGSPICWESRLADV